WDVAAGKAVCTYARPASKKEVWEPDHLTFSADGRYLAATSKVHDTLWTASVWEVKTGKHLCDLDDGLDKLGVLAFAPDGRYLAGLFAAKVRLWDPATGKQVRGLEGEVKQNRAIAFSPDGKRLIAVGETARLWDTTSGEEIPLPVDSPTAGFLFSGDGG